MVVVPSFPLLNLPLLPLNEVINYMSPLHILLLSTLSEKTRNAVIGKQKFNLEVIDEPRLMSHQILCKNQNGSTFLRILIKNKVYIHSYKNCIDQPINGLIVPMILEENSITSFWNDKIKGYQAMTSFLCNVSRIPSISFSFYDNKDTSEVVEYIQNEKRELKKNISEILISHLFISEISFREVLDKFMDVPKLNIRSGFVEYKHTDVQSSTDNCYCYIYNACLFKLEDMNLLIKCKKIRLWDVKWSTQEVNQFLKKWMEDSILEEVELAVDNVDFRMTIEGLLITLKRKNLEFLPALNGGMKNCFEIQRKDGIKANLWRDRDTFVMQTFK